VSKRLEVAVLAWHHMQSSATARNVPEGMASLGWVLFRRHRRCLQWFRSLCSVFPCCKWRHGRTIV